MREYLRFLTVVLANMESNIYKHPLDHKKAFTNIFRNEKRERSSLKGKIFNDSSQTCRDTSFKPFEGHFHPLRLGSRTSAAAAGGVAAFEEQDVVKQ